MKNINSINESHIMRFDDIQNLEFRKGSLEHGDKVKQLIEFLRIYKDQNEDTMVFNIKDFEKAMSDDLNTPRALAVLWEVARKGNKKTIAKMDEVFGLRLLEKDNINIPADIKKMADARLSAREKKDWAASDKLRDELKEKGWNIKDSSDGYVLEKE